MKKLRDRLDELEARFPKPTKPVTPSGEPAEGELPQYLIEALEDFGYPPAEARQIRC